MLGKYRRLNMVSFFLSVKNDFPPD
jgi:hypothetical protein